MKRSNIYLGGTLTLMSIFKVEQAIAALPATAFLQILKESVISRIARSDDFNVYLPLIFDVEDHISVLFVFLYLLVRCLADVRDCYSGCLNETSTNMYYYRSRTKQDKR